MGTFVDLASDGGKQTMFGSPGMRLERSAMIGVDTTMTKKKSSRSPR